MSVKGRKSSGNPHKEDDRCYIKERKSLPIILRNGWKNENLNTTKHLTVSGDRISYSSPHRNFIYHRQPFDWYNMKRALVLDDMEEILPIPGSLSRPHVKSIYNSSHLFKAFLRYAPPAKCGESEECGEVTPEKKEEKQIKEEVKEKPKTQVNESTQTEEKTITPRKRKPFRILILHGYKHNQPDFYEKTDYLRNEFKDIIEFVYVQAPHIIAKASPETNYMDQYAWWLKTKEFPDIHFPSIFDKTLEYLNKIFALKGPFDGVFGFSQGGATTAILCNLITDKELCKKYDSIYFRFAILVGTCRSDEEHLSRFYDSKNQIDIPTLHIFGRTDAVIPCEASFDLTDYFHKPKIYFHEYGHIIPGDFECFSSIRDFLEEMRKKFN